MQILRSLDHFIVHPQLGIFSFDNDEVCQLRVVSEVLLRFCQLWPHVLVDKCCKLFRFLEEQTFYRAPLSTYLPLLVATNIVKGLVFLVFWAFLLDMSHLGRISRIANYFNLNIITKWQKGLLRYLLKPSAFPTGITAKNFNATGIPTRKVEKYHQCSLLQLFRT